MADQIIIQELVVQTVIGCLDWERQILQPLHIDITLDVDMAKAAETDNLEYTVNYQQVCDDVSQLIIDTKAKLLEHLAEKIAQHVLKQYPVSRIDICIRKPAAVAGAKQVAVRIDRTK